MNNAAFDIVMGLSMMYLSLSLLCTVINDFLAALVRLRSRTLKCAIGEIIDVQQLQDDFYNHGLIGSVKSLHRKGRVPNIPSKNFAMAVLDSLDPDKPLPGFTDIENSVRGLPDSNIRDMLLTNIMLAENNVEKLRNNVAGWFDKTMENVSDLYKRKLRMLSFVVGIFVAVAVNADTFTVTKALWHDRALRAQMVDTVDRILPDSENATIHDVMLVENELRPLPIGWDLENLRLDMDMSGTYHYWISKIAGLLVTGIALSLGAPFWFDILSKITNIRGAAGKTRRSTDMVVR